MGERTVDPRYLDFVNADASLRDRRSREASSHLEILFGQISLPPTGFLEIGSGIGGVTKTLRENFPDAPIIAMDGYDHPSVAKAAELHNAQFILDNALNIDESFVERMQAANINTVVAMRVPGEVVLHLWDILSRSGFQGNLAASVIRLPVEEKAMRTIADKQYAIGHPIPFSQSMIMEEIGYYASFPLAQKEQVA